MKAQESKGTSRLLVAVAVMAAVAALALALWGCAPQATTSMAATGGDAEATEEAAPSMYPDFTDRTSGNFNDTFSTTDMLNAGNRGLQRVPRGFVGRHEHEGRLQPHPDPRGLRQGAHLSGLRAVPPRPHSAHRPVPGRPHSRGPLRQQGLPGGQRQLLELPCHELRRQPGRLPAGAVGRLLR